MTQPEDEPSNPMPPEIIMGVGRYIMGFGYLEIVLHLTFAQIIGDSVGIAHAILSKWQSFAARLDVILDIVSLYPESSAGHELMDLETRIRAINTVRNKLAHGAYAHSDGGGEAIVISFLVGERKPVETRLTVSLLDAQQAELRAVANSSMRWSRPIPLKSSRLPAARKESLTPAKLGRRRTGDHRGRRLQIPCRFQR